MHHVELAVTNFALLLALELANFNGQPPIAQRWPFDCHGIKVSLVGKIKFTQRRLDYLTNK